jgi:arylsulfatase A-like enzyme
MPPNIVIIMTDQQRADLVARAGYALDTMPFCDALARSGQWFDRAATPSPQCVPARVSMFTGRFPSAHGVRTNHHAIQRPTPDLVSLLRQAGYRTALCGKNHSHLPGHHFDAAWEYWHCRSTVANRAPEDEAFEDYLDRSVHHLVREPTPFPPERQFPHRIVDHACQWVDAQAGQPFFLWLSFPEPHNPYQVPHPYYDLFPPASLPPAEGDEGDLAGRQFAWRWCRDAFTSAFPDYRATRDRARSNYLGMLRLLDDQIARFVGHLDRRGLRERTLLIVTSDHGDFAGAYGLLRKGPGLPEVLTRIPMIWNGPGVAAGDGANPAHVSLVDVLPTLCALAGIAPPTGVQGRDLGPLLRGADDPARFRSMLVEQGFGGAAHDGSEPHDPRSDGWRPSPGGDAWGAYDELNGRTQSGVRRAVRCGDWKIIAHGDGTRELYDLASDPFERCNRWSDPACAAARQRLTDELLGWLLHVEDPLPPPQRRYQLRPTTAICPPQHG